MRFRVGARQERGDEPPPATGSPRPAGAARTPRRRSRGRSRGAASGGSSPPRPPRARRGRTRRRPSCSRPRRASARVRGFGAVRRRAPRSRRPPRPPPSGRTARRRNRRTRRTAAPARTAISAVRFWLTTRPAPSRTRAAAARRASGRARRGHQHPECDHRAQRERDREVADVAGEGARVLAGAHGFEAKRAPEAAGFEDGDESVDRAGGQQHRDERAARLRQNARGAERQQQREHGDGAHRVEGERAARRREGGHQRENEGARRQGEGRAAQRRTVSPAPRGEGLPRKPSRPRRPAPCRRGR